MPEFELPAAVELDTMSMVDIDYVCRFWGGTTPITPATVYRQIAKGQHPKPVKCGTLSRWLLGELHTERDRRVAARNMEAA